MMSGKPLHDAAPIVGMLCLAAGIALIAAHCTGCVDPKTPDPGIVDVASESVIAAQYKLAMIDCRKKAVAAKDIAVFDECADAVDTRFCQQYKLRCVDGGAP